MSSKIIGMLAVLASLSLSARVYLPPHIMPMHIRPDNVIIAWDIHNVLAQDGGKLRKFGQALPDLFTVISTKLAGDASWQEIQKLSKQMDISGEARYEIFLKYGQKDLALMVERAANEYTPRKDMERIVRALDAHGIPQYIASDIGPLFFDNLKTKFKKHKCCVFDIIKPGKIVDYSQFGPNKGKRTLTDDLTLFCKPHPEFFAQFAITYDPFKKWYKILIDDNMKNIQAALKAGWIGIHFDIKQHKPVERLYKELASLNLI